MFLKQKDQQWQQTKTTKIWNMDVCHALFCNMNRKNKNVIKDCIFNYLRLTMKLYRIKACETTLLIRRCSCGVQHYRLSRQENKNGWQRARKKLNLGMCSKALIGHQTVELEVKL